MTDHPHIHAQPVPEQLREPAAAVFGQRLSLAERYAEILTSRAVQWGLIGPREAPRIWQRHLLNCAVLAELIPYGVDVADVGSGAGLPGLVLAITRPDLRVTLVESLLRRAQFLTDTIDELGLIEQAQVVRGRAEELAKTLSASVVTARAVAPLPRLIDWCLPLASSGGRLLAIKGESVASEVEQARKFAKKQLGSIKIHACGVGLIDPPVTVVEVIRR